MIAGVPYFLRFFEKWAFRGDDSSTCRRTVPDCRPASHRGADVKLFPACRNESKFVLSINPDPVSTKLGTGA
jgi:hypothetical protein